MIQDGTCRCGTLYKLNRRVLRSSLLYKGYLSKGPCFQNGRGQCESIVQIGPEQHHTLVKCKKRELVGWTNTRSLGISLAGRHWDWDNQSLNGSPGKSLRGRSFSSNAAVATRLRSCLCSPVAQLVRAMHSTRWASDSNWPQRSPLPLVSCLFPSGWFRTSTYLFHSGGPSRKNSTARFQYKLVLCSAY